jgi:DNA-binding CsgD family transcriptional regulator
MILSVKEKEKYVIELRKQGKTYRDIAYELKISPREISKILKKASGEIEEKERKKIVLSKTAQALQLYKKGKSPIDVAIKLDLSPQEVNSIYDNYLSLNNLHHFIETFKEFDKSLLLDFIDYYDFMRENGIDKKKIVEAIKISNDYPKIKDEYDGIINKIEDLVEQKNFYISDNKLLELKNCELNNEYESLVLKITSADRMLQSIKSELNNKRDLLENINNSEDYNNLKIQIEEIINNFLNCKKDFFKLAITIIFDIIKKYPKKDILISNIINTNGNPDSDFYLDYYEDKISQIATDTLFNIASKINTNNILKS